MAALEQVARPVLLLDAALEVGISAFFDFLILLPESLVMESGRVPRFTDDDGSQCDSSTLGEFELQSGEG